MTYMALYRKWRPTVFEDVVGQKHITQTLKNQIKQHNIAHAYLFCGTRGTGKTSTAKIFAKAVNCLSPQNHNPCNQCEVCQGIQSESIMDVMEIDAASNNGVDNIRELRENVKYPPTRGRYKVYIIDEVHMLSTGAFNALLKTLEEPPHYIIFILATTEPHKIPATILSRCQRFDFKRVKESDIVARLSYICNEIGIEAEDSAIRLIARNSDGAMRDALSILDQCVSFSTGKINYNDVIDILGTVNDDFLFRLVDYIAAGDSKNAIALIEELVQSGKDIHQFMKDLISHYRNLMMTRVAQQLEGIVSLSKENIERLKEQGKKLEMNSIIRAIHTLSEMESQAKWSSQPRILLEVGVIKLTQPMLDQSLEGLVERVAALEKKIQTGTITIKGDTKSKTEGNEKKPQEPIPLRNTPSDELTKQTDDFVQILDFENLKHSWNTILQEIKKRKISVYAWVMEGKPAAVEKNTLVISFEDRFALHKEATAKSPNKEFIEEIITEMMGQKVQIKCVMEDELHTFSAAANEISVSEEEEVKKIIELFGEDMVEIIE